MPSERHSESIPQPSPPQRPTTSDTSEMLTPSELEELQRVSRENVASLQKAFPDLKTLP